MIPNGTQHIRLTRRCLRCTCTYLDVANNLHAVDTARSLQTTLASHDPAEGPEQCTLHVQSKHDLSHNLRHPPCTVMCGCCVKGDTLKPINGKRNSRSHCQRQQPRPAETHERTNVTFLIGRTRTDGPMYAWVSSSPSNLESGDDVETR